MKYRHAITVTKDGHSYGSCIINNNPRFDVKDSKNLMKLQDQGASVELLSTKRVGSASQWLYTTDMDSALKFHIKGKIH